MDGRELLEHLRARFSAEPSERCRTLARLACVLKPDADTLRFLEERIGPEKAGCAGELLERIAQIDPEFLAGVVDRAGRGGAERSDLVAREFNRTTVLSALCGELERLVEAGAPQEAVERIATPLALYGDERLVFFLVRHLYPRGAEEPVPVFARMLAAHAPEAVAAAIDRAKDCGDGRFLFNAILHLKAAGDRTRVLKLVELYSKLEYGVDAKEAAARIGGEMARVERDPSRKLVLVLTGSQSITALIERALEKKVDVEQCAIEDPDALLRNLAERVPELVVVDRSHARRLGLSFALKIARERPGTPVVFACDALGEQEKADLFKAGIRDYVTIPFTLEEMRDKIGDAIERSDRERVTRKAQFAVDAGRDLFREGDSGDCCFVIKSGSVKIWRRDAAGHEIHLVTLGASEIFGEMALIDKSARSATATAVERTELLRIEECNFEKVLQSNPGFALKLITILVKRLRGVTDRLKELEMRERSRG